MKAVMMPSGKYIATAFLGKDAAGNRIRKSFSHSDPKMAVALAQDYAARYAGKISRDSVQAAMNRFLAARASSLSPTTLSDYRSRCKTLCANWPRFVRKPMHAISADDLRQLVADMSSVAAPRHRLNRKPLALAPKTIKNYMIFLSAVWRHAGLLLPQVELPQRVIPDLYIPTDEEIGRLLASLAGKPLLVPVMLAAFAPLRRGEICALSYPEDFRGRIIHVHASVADVGDAPVRKAPKTYHSDRFIELPAFVVAEIERQGFVTDLTPKSITRRFPAALRAAKLPPFRFHDLRHYCVSSLHAQGVSTASIVKRCGHATDSMVQRVYRHILADQDALQNQKANDHFEQVALRSVQ